MMEYYIASVKHTRRDQKYITFWRPDNKGYCWPLSWAGKYSEERVKEHLDYYNRGDDSIAVPCILIDNLAVPSKKGDVDNDAGPVVLNNSANWKCIIEFGMEGRMYKPEPQYRGARYPKENND